MKYKITILDEKGKCVSSHYFKTRRQAKVAQRAVLKGKWFKFYRDDGTVAWEFINSDTIRRAYMKAVTVKKVEYE